MDKSLIGMENTQQVADSSALVFDVDMQNFSQKVIQASRDVPVLVDFWAPWCGPCKMLTPTIEELANDYEGKVKIGKMKNRSLTQFCDWRAGCAMRRSPR